MKNFFPLHYKWRDAKKEVARFGLWKKCRHGSMKYVDLDVVLLKEFRITIETGLRSVQKSYLQKNSVKKGFLRSDSINALMTTSDGLSLTLLCISFQKISSRNQLKVVGKKL